MKVNTQAGFTLIELIVVITILGILSVFAIPKFIDIEAGAKKSASQGVSGAIASASALAHALTFASGNGSASNASIIMEGETVTMAFGYPTGDLDGIGKAVTSDVTPTVTTAPNVASYVFSTCTITYTEASSATVPPAIATTGTGCI